MIELNLSMVSHQCPNFSYFSAKCTVKPGHIAGRTVRNLEFFLHFCLTNICLKKCATFAPFLLKTKI